MRKLTLLFSAFLLVAGVSACGSSGSDSSDAFTTTTTGDASGSKTTTGGGKTTTTEQDGKKTDDPYVAAFVKSFTDPSRAGKGALLDDKQAECLAPKWVDTIGTDTFQSKKVTPADVAKATYGPADLGLDEDQASDLVDAYDECDVDLLGQLRESINSEATDEERACIDRELSDETIVEVYRQALYRAEPDAELKAESGRLKAACGL